MIQDLPQDLINTATEVLEARRNPDQNPRIGPLSRLEEYKDDPNIFISFTEIDKIGLNPLSKYNTPLGIYTYPLKVSWDYYNVDKELRGQKFIFASDEVITPSKLAKAERSTIQIAFPFATQNPYIQVIESKNPLTDLQKFSKRDFDNALGMIEKLLPELSSYPSDILSHLDQITKRNAKVRSPGGRFWYLTYLLTNRDEQFSWLDDDADEILAYAFLNKYKTKSGMRAWNYLLRDLGHEGFLDNGEGIIHSGEPAQAVFLHRGAFKKIDRVFNKASALSQKKNETPEWLFRADTYDEDYSIIGGVVVWHGGVWADGIWKGGTWETGTFKEGTFESGLWKDGIWEFGSFGKGRWENGIWKNGYFHGIWEFGVVNGDTYASFGEDCVWERGRWEPQRGKFSGVWHDGVFDSAKSDFEGTWKGGIFVNGLFGSVLRGNKKPPRWEGGEWKGGDWAPGSNEAEIYSKRFDQFILSKVPPPEFYLLENDDSITTPEELKKAATP